jgi:hypothetical protein
MISKSAASYPARDTPKGTPYLRSSRCCFRFTAGAGATEADESFGPRAVHRCRMTPTFGVKLEVPAKEGWHEHYPNPLMAEDDRFRRALTPQTLRCDEMPPRPRAFLGPRCVATALRPDHGRGCRLPPGVAVEDGCQQLCRATHLNRFQAAFSPSVPARKSSTSLGRTSLRLIRMAIDRSSSISTGRLAMRSSTEREEREARTPPPHRSTSKSTCVSCKAPMWPKTAGGVTGPFV